MNRLLFFLCAFMLCCSYLHAENSTKNEASKPKDEIYMKKIEDLLRVEMINKCSFDSNPKISEICVDYKAKTGKFIKFNDIIDALMNLECNPETGSSCHIDTSNIHNYTTNFFNKYGESFCRVTPCFLDVNSYATKCISENSTKLIYNSIPYLCAIYRESNYNNICLHESFSIIFSSLLALKSENSSSCFNGITGVKGECKKECRELSSKINHLDTCCSANIELIKSFKIFDWYFDNREDLRKKCDLPIKSICFKDGKYFFEFTKKITVILSIILAVSILLIIVSCYLLCKCMRMKTRITEMKVETYKYTHLPDISQYDEETLEYRDTNDDIKPDMNSAV